jgi:hypothetical protein
MRFPLLHGNVEFGIWVCGTLSQGRTDCAVECISLGMER